eukprot:m51a1_g6433 putative branched-chain amino acid aminotransferase (372) ;mRNA; r:362474-364190
MSAGIDHKKLVIEKRPDLQPKPKDITKLVFGHTFTDHMLEIDWTAEHGWGVPRIHAYGPLALDPAASVLHYAMECFEGMKAFRDPKGHLRMFRPMMNMERMVRSGKRVALPEFDGAELLECIKALVHLDQDWCPTGRGYSLYIRPTFISTHAAVGVQWPEQAKIFVILSPVGPYYATGWKAVKLVCSDGTYCRAFPGGTGCYKVGGNYALSMVPQEDAHHKGYQQVLWLHNKECTEVGTMNFFLYWINEQGKKELITCPLNDMILPGVTRDSVLRLAREMHGDIVVSERTYTIDQVIKALKENRVLEAFGTGTAAVISPVCAIAYEGQEYHIPVDTSDPKSQIGPLAKKLYESLAAIQYGEVDHPWTITVQ